MRRLLLAFVIGCLGCQQQTPAATSAPPPTPPPVRPVEVSTNGTTQQQEIDTLRTRVTDLEQRLARCESPPAAQLPTGVDPPPPATTPVPATTPSTTPTTATHPTTARRHPGLIEELLGGGEAPPPPRRRNEPTKIELPNPGNIL